MNFSSLIKLDSRTLIHVLGWNLLLKFQRVKQKEALQSYVEASYVCYSDVMSLVYRERLPAACCVYCLWLFSLTTRHAQLFTCLDIYKSPMATVPLWLVLYFCLETLRRKCSQLWPNLYAFIWTLAYASASGQNVEEYWRVFVQRVFHMGGYSDKCR